MRWWAAAACLCVAGCHEDSPPAAPPGCDGDCGGGGGSSSEDELAVLCHGAPMVGAEIVAGASARVECAEVALTITPMTPEVARLRYVAAGEPEPTRPSYAVVAAPDASVRVAVGGDAERLVWCSGGLVIEVERASCRVRARDESGVVISDDPDGGGFARAGGGRGLVRAIAEGERFYGLGERTGALDRRGRAFTFWNTDAYVAEWGGYPPGADPLYQSIPFFVGLRHGSAYGVFLDNTHRLEVDMGARDPTRYRLWAAGGALDAYLIAGPKIPAVVERYAALTGTMPRPPRWTLGYHQSRWGYHPAAQVRDVAQSFRDRGIGADGIWLDIQHLDGFRSFTWDPLGFAAPAALVGELAALGFKTVAIVDPAIKVDAQWDVYAEGLAGGHFLPHGGEPYVGEVWPGAAVFPDFSAPATRDWWAALLPRTLDPGVRGLWIDMNEPSDFSTGTGTVPDELAAAGDGTPSTMAELHNVYALGEARATFTGMRAARPDARPFVLSRAGYAGIQRYAAVWTGDAPSRWETLGETLPMLLGLGLSGVPFVGSDVGGYSGGASPELFARWMQLGSLSPFFRGHVQTGANAQEPWQLGTEVEDISRQAIAARYELLPTWYSLVDEAVRTGAPLLRPLVYAFQDDPATHAIGDQALLGDSLLVAPVLTQGAATRSVYLPAGRWFEARSGAIYDGPATIEVGVTLGALPLFVREGGVVAKGPALAWSDEAPLAPLALEVYPRADGQPSRFTFYEDEGDGFGHETGVFRRVRYQLEPSPSGALLRAALVEGSYAPPARALVVRVRRVDHGVEEARLDGQALPEHPSLEALTAAAHGFFYDARDRSLVVAFADRDAFELDMRFDPSIDELRPPVAMPFVVELPPGTTGTIHLASSASGWQHEPLAPGPGPDQAQGLIVVPRGEYVFYKYTRGDWSTVEKWPGCVEATNRYELGAAQPVKRDRVFAWADACP